MDLYQLLGQPSQGQETGPRATQGQDPGPVGLCDCPEGHDVCTCSWGALISWLRAVAYELPADQALTELPHLQMRLTSRLHTLRQEALQERAAAWVGTVNTFMRHYQLTRATYDRLALKVPRN